MLQRENQGLRGKSGFEIAAKLDVKDSKYYLLVDIKNCTNSIQEMSDLIVLPGFPFMELDSGQDALVKGRPLQKNEICMLELGLQQTLVELKLDNLFSNPLSLQAKLIIGNEEFTLQIPYLLNVLLDSYDASANEEEIAKKVGAAGETAVKFKMENYEESLGKFGKVFDSNRVYKLKFKNLYYMRIQKHILGAFAIEKKCDAELEATLWPFVDGAKPYLQAYISYLIDLI